MYHSQGQQQDYVTQRVAAMRKATFETTPQITLGELINLLKAVDAAEDCHVTFAFGNLVPTSLRSWRGAYRELAIGYKDAAARDYAHVSLPDFIKQLEDAVGAVFTGWKGGEYVMFSDTPVWVANAGESGNTGIIGIHVAYGANKKAYYVYIRTDYCEY